MSCDSRRSDGTGWRASADRKPFKGWGTENRWRGFRNCPPWGLSPGCGLAAAVELAARGHSASPRPIAIRRQSQVASSQGRPSQRHALRNSLGRSFWTFESGTRFAFSSRRPAGLATMAGVRSSRATRLQRLDRPGISPEFPVCRHLATRAGHQSSSQTNRQQLRCQPQLADGSTRRRRHTIRLSRFARLWPFAPAR